MKLSFPKLTKKKVVGLIAAFLVAIFLIVWLLGSFGGKDAALVSAEYEAFTVKRGDITVSVTGSGTVQPIEQYEIQSIVTGEILEDFVVEGADVTKDQVLYIVDSESAENSIERSETSYEQQLISYNEKVKNYNEAQANRTVEAPISGVITEMYVENGDEVNAGAKLCEIRNTEYLTVRIPFLAANAQNIYVNQAATIYFDDRNESHNGTVSHVTTGTYTTEAGAIVSDIEITFKNPGAILPGETVTATVGSYACNDTGTVEEATVKAVTAEVSGEIKALSYAKGDKVTGGNLILKITDDSSNSDLRNSELSLKNSKLSLDDQIERLDDYTIKSPIAGTVISKTMKEGDTLDGNKSSLAIVADMSKLTFEISVDELYIQSIKVGQKVSVTADAAPDKTFEGVVDTVSIIGTATSGVTVYPVTIVISEYDGLLPGMNVDAEIDISNATDVLMIPVNAVTRGNLVLVAEDSDISGISLEDTFKKMTPPEGMTRPEGMTPPEGEERPERFEKNDTLPENDMSAKDGNLIEKKSDSDKALPDSRKDISEDASAKKREIKLPDAPEGYKYIMVETGDANDDYVEIVSGLSEGDVIYYTVVKNTSTATSPFGMGGGMPGGMGGGMPSGMSGGMRSGGMSGSRSGGMSGMPGGMR